MNSQRFLIIVLAERPLSFLASKETLDSLAAKAGAEYLIPFGTCGHFDWLRVSTGVVIGVRCWLFEEEEEMPEVQAFLSEVNSRDYFEVSRGRSFSCFFCEGDSNFDEDISEDQDLGDCGIIRLNDGVFGLYFDADLIFKKGGVLPIYSLNDGAIYELGRYLAV